MSALRDFGEMLLLASVVIAPLGVLFGLAGGAWIAFVARKPRSRLALTLHGALAGLVLGGIFILLDLHNEGGVPPGIGGFAAMSLIVGGILGATYVSIFWRLLYRGDVA